MEARVERGVGAFDPDWWQPRRVIALGWSGGYILSNCNCATLALPTSFDSIRFRP